MAKGDVLVTFESGEVDADVGQLSTDLSAFQAEAARRRTALDAISDRTIEPIPAVAWSADIPETIRLREDNILAGDLGKLDASIEALQAQIRQKRSERERFARTVAAVENLVATLQSRVDMRTSLN